MVYGESMELFRGAKQEIIVNINSLFLVIEYLKK